MQVQQQPQVALMVATRLVLQVVLPLVKVGVELTVKTIAFQAVTHLVQQYAVMAVEIINLIEFSKQESCLLNYFSFYGN